MVLFDLKNFASLFSMYEGSRSLHSLFLSPAKAILQLKPLKLMRWSGRPELDRGKVVDGNMGENGRTAQ